MHRHLGFVITAAVLIALAGCGGEATAPTPSPSASAPPPAAGDTTKLRAASAIGYDGAGLQRSVDRMKADAATRAKAADDAARGADAPADGATPP